MLDVNLCKTELNRLIRNRRGLDYASLQELRDHQRWVDEAAQSGVGADLLEQLHEQLGQHKDTRREGGD
jgi:hypothetical protein